MKAMTLAIALGIAGCAYNAIPHKFIQDGSVWKCGYHVDSSGEDGFVFEVCLQKYSFMPNPDEAIQAARNCFATTAASVASRQGKEIAALTSSDMAIQKVSRNLNGDYVVFVKGKVRFAAE